MTGEKYRPARSEHFVRDYASAVRKNKPFQDQVDKKILQILENPAAFKPLKQPLAGYRRVHVSSYVITFRIDGNIVRFVRIAHHEFFWNSCARTLPCSLHHDRIYGLPHD